MSKNSAAQINEKCCLQHSTMNNTGSKTPRILRELVIQQKRGLYTIQCECNRPYQAAVQAANIKENIPRNMRARTNKPTIPYPAVGALSKNQMSCMYNYFHFLHVFARSIYILYCNLLTNKVAEGEKRDPDQCYRATIFISH